MIRGEHFHPVEADAVIIKWVVKELVEVFHKRHYSPMRRGNYFFFGNN
jgi:hypothetical protein